MLVTNLKLTCSFALFLAIIANLEVSATTDPKEQVALRELRKLVQNHLYTDYFKSDSYLLRWLKIHRLDVNKTADKLKKALQWRKENNIDNILNESLSREVEKQSKFYTDGVDKSGNPILTMDWSHLDIRKFVLAGRQAEVLRYYIKMWETMELKIQDIQNKTGNHDISQAVGIFNIQGYNLRQHACLTCFRVFFDMQKVVTSYYAGIVKNAYLINAPKSFARLADFLKNVLSEEERKLFNVYSVDKSEWTPLLFKTIDPAQLRPEFGGTKTSK